jgi:hypothetical protein
MQKIYFFFAWPFMDSQQHGLALASFRIRYVFFIGSRLDIKLILAFGLYLISNMYWR